MGQEEDEALVAGALRGSRMAWDELVRRYESRIYNQGLRLTGNPSDAMDLVQEVFIGIFRNLHKFRGDAKFSSWLFRIAHNKAIDLNRRRRLGTSQPQSGSQVGGAGEGDAEFDIIEATPAREEDEPDARTLVGERNRMVAKLLSKLPIEQRLVIEMKVYQGLTFEEIGAQQDISDNTAKTRFYNALRKMKQMMEERNELSGDPAANADLLY